MPIAMIIGLVALAVLIVTGLGIGTYLFTRQLLDEKRNPVPEWDRHATQELHLWLREQEKDKKRCPDCQGTRCWDYTRNERGCGESPTLADSPPNILAQGRHHFHTIIKVPAGWWPLPRTRMGRLNPELWRKVADHAKIPVVYPRVCALP